MGDEWNKGYYACQGFLPDGKTKIDYNDVCNSCRSNVQKPSNYYQNETLTSYTITCVASSSEQYRYCTLREPGLHRITVQQILSGCQDNPKKSGESWISSNQYVSVNENCSAVLLIEKIKSDNGQYCTINADCKSGFCMNNSPSTSNTCSSQSGQSASAPRVNPPSFKYNYNNGAYAKTLCSSKSINGIDTCLRSLTFLFKDPYLNSTERQTYQNWILDCKTDGTSIFKSCNTCTDGGYNNPDICR